MVTITGVVGWIEVAPLEEFEKTRHLACLVVIMGGVFSDDTVRPYNLEEVHRSRQVEILPKGRTMTF